MKRSENVEIDRLLSEIADEGTSRDRVNRLDALLRDRPELQAYYAQAMALHMLLAYELDLSLQQLQPVMPAANLKSNPRHTAEGDRCVELSHRIGRDVPARVKKRQRGPNRLAISIAIAVGAIGVSVATWFAGNNGRWSEDARLAAGSQHVMPESAEVPLSAADLVVRDTRSLAMFSRLTKTALLTSLQLPRCAPGGSLNMTLCSGTAWMERSPGDRERGYLVELPPGCLMDLHVDTDAEGQNALAIVEIDKRGRMTGGTLSFNNLVEGDVSTMQRRTGCIGNYSVLNDSASTKYYLFAGSHILPQQSVDDSWYQSDYKVQHKSRDFMVIGWDDSGHTSVAQPTHGDYTPDRDYNDICALLRFSRPNAEIQPVAADVQYSPPPDENLPSVHESETGYRLDVRPGEQLVMLVSSSASLHNLIRIAEKPSCRVLWEQTGCSNGDSSLQNTEVGVYIIRNNSDTIRQYELLAQHIKAGQTEWSNSPYKLLADGDGSVTVGFEDSIAQSELIDWNDIRVHARWFSN